MKLNRFLSLALAGICTFSLLAGCGGEEPVASTPPVAHVEATQYGADVEAIVDRGVLRVGVKNNVVGFGFQDILNNTYSGMEIDLGQQIADALGVDIEYTTVTAATRSELLDSGDLDCVIATFTVTDERKESWSFTTPYYVDTVTALVEGKSNITALSDLVDGTVGVSSGSTSARAMVARMIELDLIDGTGFNPDTFDATTWTEGVSFRQYDDYPAISTALYAGEVDAFCVDRSILSFYNTDGRHYIEDTFSPQDYGIATVLDSGMSQLCEELISGWLADGTIDGLIAKHNL